MYRIMQDCKPHDDNTNVPTCTHYHGVSSDLVWTVAFPKDFFSGIQRPGSVLTGGLPTVGILMMPGGLGELESP
jgi:hypothetical protein